MLTPNFELKQTESHVILVIKAPLANVARTELVADDFNVFFSSPPYYLRLKLPGRVQESPSESGTYDFDSGTFTFRLEKSVQGQDFEDLDLIGKFLFAHKKYQARPKIEVLEDDVLPSTDPESDGEFDDEEFWISQQPNPPVEELSTPGYGFANKVKGNGEALRDEFREILDLPDVESTAIAERGVQRYQAEQEAFSDEHYLADFMEPSEIRAIIDFKAPWEQLTPGVDEINIFRVNSYHFPNAHVNLTVFYQSRCNDSALFFEEQLKPALTELQSRQTGVSLELVPYGRATSTNIGGNYIFSCERGEEECEGNKFHACIVNRSQGMDVMMLNMLACMFDRFSMDTPEEHFIACSANYEYFSYEDLQMCATSSEGSQLLYNNGIVTAKWRPYFMPTILLNGDAGDDQFQSQLKKNLLGTVMKYVPAIAAKSNSTSAMNSVTRGAHVYKWSPAKASGKCAEPILLILLISPTLGYLHFD